MHKTFFKIYLNEFGFTYYPESKTIANKNENIELHIGSKIKIVLSDVDLAEREIKFELLEPLDLTNQIKRIRKK